MTVVKYFGNSLEKSYKMGAQPFLGILICDVINRKWGFIFRIEVVYDVYYMIVVKYLGNSLENSSKIDAQPFLGNPNYNIFNLIMKKNLGNSLRKPLKRGPSHLMTSSIGIASFLPFFTTFKQNPPLWGSK